jgi:Ni2+-binding GTPase involved in maturation of urease and hydrogenase
MDVDAPWERSFQFRPFAVGVFGAYGAGATAIPQQIARKLSEHTSMTVGAQ